MNKDKEVPNDPEISKSGGEAVEGAVASSTNTPTHGAAEETSAEERKEAITAAKAWRQVNWYDEAPEQLDEALAAYAASLREELANETYICHQLNEQIAGLMPMAQRCSVAESELAESGRRVEGLQAAKRHWQERAKRAESVLKRQEGR